jgi:hypothetical protein
MVTYRQLMPQSFEVAMLKLVLRTKREPQIAFDALVHEVCEQMEVDELGFKRYIAQHMRAFVRPKAH